MSDIAQETIRYAAFAAFNILVAKEVNTVVNEPYMDEPFHIPQAQAYCRGEWDSWDPKITTPPGLYLLSVILKKIFLFKCTIGTLRLTNILLLSFFPPLISSLQAKLRRIDAPQSWLEPTLESIVISAFPITWFFAFLYYTETGSVFFVLACLLAALHQKHWLAALLGLISCTFRQTNIVWVFYALGLSLLKTLHLRRVGHSKHLHDPVVVDAKIEDFAKSVMSLPRAILPLLPFIIPYALLALVFTVFVVWNGGIVLGDKSNHIPQMHIPQLFYFVGFCTALGFPVLIGGPGGLIHLVKAIVSLIAGTWRRLLLYVTFCVLTGTIIHFFTIHHPFLLSDNRHYTFYVWNRLYRRHSLVPYILSPVYVTCYYAWFIRLYYPPSMTLNDEQPVHSKQIVHRSEKSLLEALLLPICLLPTLLPTPLLEPRYFLIPWLLLRLQIDPPQIRSFESLHWSLLGEGVWNAVINWGTMYVFLYKYRPGVGRFMW
ncbi:glucosyltransferase [Cantharellus anzutake]|uniref:glucosyltransferase n=1 Tax=Cantharellus anzutake TaxID=1750568 RepID=UPI0019052D4E|nr:glucosyltransferase [Cantharellus anzutake]KAF8342782.1 glucosyltransferase [Cantharellus anzutake]